MVGFSTTNFTRAWEPTLSWNHLCSEPLPRCLTVATPSDSAACKVKSWLSHMMAAKRLGLKLTNIHVPADNPDLNLEEETARLKDVLAFMDTVDTVFD